MQAPMSGQISGQVANQAGSQLSALPSQNNTLAAHIRNLAAAGVPFDMDTDTLLKREYARQRILQLLQQKAQGHHMYHRLPDVAKRLEEKLFNDAKGVYLNLETLERHLHALVMHLNFGSQNRNNQLHQNGPSSSRIATMIPTPGIMRGSIANSGASSGECSMLNSTSVPISTINPGNLVSSADGASVLCGGSFNVLDETVANRFQQPSSSQIPRGGNGFMASMGMPRLTSHMIPTPGFNKSQSMPTNSEGLSGCDPSSVEPVIMSQHPLPKQYVGGQNGRLFQSLSSEMGTNVRSNLQLKTSYGYPNGVINGGLQLVGNNLHHDGSSASEGYLNIPPTDKDMRDLSQQSSHGDISGVNATQLDGRNALMSRAPNGPIVNSQNLTPASFHSRMKSNSGLPSHQSSFSHGSELMKAQMFGQSGKMNFQSRLPSKEHIMQAKHEIHKLQQQYIQQQPFPDLAQYSNQQKYQEQSYQRQLIKNDVLVPPHLCDVNAQFAPEIAMSAPFEAMHAQNTEDYHFSQPMNQHHEHIAVSERSAQPFCSQSTSQDFPIYFPQALDQEKLLPDHKHAESHGDFGSLSARSQPEPLLQGHWQHGLMPKLEQVQTDQNPYDCQMKEFHQRITREDEAQRPVILNGSVGSRPVLSNVVAQPNVNGTINRSEDAIREQDYAKQRKWLLFLHHARRCSAPEGKCEEVNCITAQQLLRHMEKCNCFQCEFPRCRQSKGLIGHFRACHLENCPVCVPVRNFVVHRRAQMFSLSDSGSVQDLRWRQAVKDAPKIMQDASTSDNLEGLQSPKRMKIDHPASSLIQKSEGLTGSVACTSQTNSAEVAKQEIQLSKEMEVNISVKPESTEDRAVQSPINLMWRNSFAQDSNSNVDIGGSVISQSDLKQTNVLSTHSEQENMLTEKEVSQDTVEMKKESSTQPTDVCGVVKTSKPKIKGVSLTELFTPEQVRGHIRGLRQWVGQSKAKAEKNQAMEQTMSENSCQLCAVEKLTFEPPPIYCTPCGARIKRNAMYYTVGTGDTRHFFCIPCYNEVRGDSIEVDGMPFPKIRLEKKKNDEETEEWWVQCDKCEAWQHQICALFNGRRNDGGQAEYTCPNCYIAEVESGKRKPLPQSAVLGAKDLPRTVLSDHIEQRLARRLKQERQERARLQGKCVDEVPGAESLVVRVVSSVDKKLEVKQRFLEIFQEDNYPSEFPYKSKVILLFQKIEGVEVCLFGMYVQEFGSECQSPNERRVYLAYLDSVKYFRPEIKAVTGEALRTFVYHEILIGYLEYCKKRGFASCYIWACPPLKGEDYILYCHPEIQKTPKSDKLREWYLSMLKKASRENIVVELTNLYDHFFIQLGECKAKITAARLPYFDGDYWPGAAEDMINQLRQDEDGRKLQKKVKTKKTITKRALKAAGQSDLSANASKDILLMQKLGETICPMKEDFIMVHLQHSCSHCCQLIVSGNCWVCGQCKNFHLCDRCYETEQRLDEKERHPIHSREKHMLSPIEIKDVPADTKDSDDILESEFFDTRQAFLSLCQGNHYQYDTLRRAKHSSMMVLYHLHNPSEPAFVTTCNVCHHDIEAGQGWRCEICPDFDVCSSCYEKDGGVDHPHKLTNYPSAAERDAQNKEARQKRVLQLRMMLDLLAHASQCRSVTCKYPRCRQVKALFRHGIQCKIRAAGGCVLCKKMWHLLQLHARACKESDCHVPRCRDLKEHVRRLQQQSDSRRRAAVNEMMRQRAAEVAGKSV